MDDDSAAVSTPTTTLAPMLMATRLPTPMPTAPCAPVLAGWRAGTSMRHRVAALGRRGGGTGPVWLFDLDDTLHDATRASADALHDAMSAYISRHLALCDADATALRRTYWRRYGATLLGMVRHHGVDGAHFLAETHRLPGLEQRLAADARDRAALRRLPGRKLVLTNAPRAYALRVLGALGLRRAVDGVIGIDDMLCYGLHRPKPDARMLRRLAAALGVSPERCVLVEDTLQHQRAAHRIGMRTVWMRRYLRAPAGTDAPAWKSAVRRCGKPAYVDRRIQALRALLRRPFAGPMRSSVRADRGGA